MFVSAYSFIPVTPNFDVGGISNILKIAGALVTFGLIAAVAGLLVCAIIMALARKDGHPQAASRALVGVVVCVVVALFSGGLDVWLNFWVHSGGTIS